MLPDGAREWWGLQNFQERSLIAFRSESLSPFLSSGERARGRKGRGGLSENFRQKGGRGGLRPPKRAGGSGVILQVFKKKVGKGGRVKISFLAAEKKEERGTL